jgi:hypothetical protein
MSQPVVLPGFSHNLIMRNPLAAIQLLHTLANGFGFIGTQAIPPIGVFVG